MRGSNTAHVLVVEDDHMLREMLAFLLREEGYTVVDVPDGQTALEVVWSSAERLVVLLDCWSPGRDGMQVLHALASAAPVLRRHAFVTMGAAHHPGLVPETLERSNALRVADLDNPFNIADLLRSMATSAAELRASDP